MTTEGQEWVRHRRLTAAIFNERNNKLVWNETRRQAEDMTQIWAASPHGFTNPGRDSMLLALHVLTGAGLGKSYKFGDGLRTPAAGHNMTYADALGIILGNIVTAISTLPSRLQCGYCQPESKRHAMLSTTSGATCLRWSKKKEMQWRQGGLRAIT